ncbi:TetR/AcrR family transcriptional regulator [Corallincola spongiicola]|uniref:TetR/AcrR family transcriptional regulator n=1 Tax=Corallincola spongiicola TaxID=2520508 RepID=A0ABY1WL12_9GAMM|nr:TetR/AcrR family transcriptional regulator [Corallincola spongiicola]TAA41014.1 TetR/AcrR family transcriptional regulator [Corallincola spongiicola]
MTDKRRRILQAASVTLANKGFHGTTMGEIAQQADMAAGTLYLYFKDKQTLLLETLENNLELIADACFKQHRLGVSLEQQFTQIWQALFQYLIAHPDTLHGWELSRHVTDKSQLAHLIKRRQQLFLPLAAMLEAGLAAQQLKPLPVEVLGAIGIESCAALARRHIEGSFILNDAMIATAANASWQAIANQ